MPVLVQKTALYSLCVASLRFQRWYHWEDIQRTCDIAVYPREGYAGTFDAPLINVSSTEIRRRVEQGESIDGLVPTQIISLVEKYYKKIR